MEQCKTCNGTGGINIEHSWGISYHPCPDSHCNFDREKAWKETELAMKRLLESLEERESA